MKKFLSVMLVLVMILSMVACGGTKKDPLVGTWKGTLDMSGFLKDTLAAEGMTVTTDISGLGFDIILTFGEDGTVTMSVDEASVAAMATKMVDVMLELTVESFKQAGVDLSALGLDEESLRAELEKEINVEELVGSFDVTSESGYYLYKDGKIYGGDTKEELADVTNSEDYMVVELNGNQLTINDIVSDGEKGSEEMAAVFPIVLTKQ